MAGWSSTPDRTAESDTLHLAMLQQFLRTATDGWDLAQASVRNLFAAEDLAVEDSGGDFAGEAARLGMALAETHETLAAHFPTETRDAAAMADLTAAMNRRLDEAIEVAPGLVPFATRLRDGVRRTERPVGCADPTHSRRSPSRADAAHGPGWKIVDFEGEPAKPLAERRLPDSRWRDVAGMLRSFDYAPRAVERSVGEGDPEDAEIRATRAAQWAARNQEAFLTAYAGRELTPDENTLLAAYIADKAVYETVYETRNRPTWVPIPLEALAKIGAP